VATRSLGEAGDPRSAFLDVCAQPAVGQIYNGQMTKVSICLAFTASATRALFALRTLHDFRQVFTRFLARIPRAGSTLVAACRGGCSSPLSYGCTRQLTRR
jgi:hypothetical protein